jgi:HSP20 family protein
MVNLMRWDPFEDRLEDVMRNFFRPAAVTTGNGAVPIRINVSETEKAYVVSADLPGVKKEDINVAIDDNQITISAETKQEKEVKEGERVLRSERHYGKVFRSFVLAQDVDEASASAKYESGVLQLTLPKKAAAKAKLLTIN